MKKNKKIVIAISSLVVLVAIGTSIYFLSDRQKFISEANNLNEYITKIEGISLNEEKYCSYGHQKYSKGDLGCQVYYTFQDSSKISRETETAKYLESIGWQYKGDNTASVNAYSDVKYTAHKVFSHGSLGCTFSSSNDNGTTIYEVGCYGPAKAEWFPVKKS